MEDRKPFVQVCSYSVGVVNGIMGMPMLVKEWAKRYACACKSDHFVDVALRVKNKVGH
jgi:hypothetical protein